MSDEWHGHLHIGELLLVLSPQLELVGAEDASLLLECLGNLGGGVVDVTDNGSGSGLFHSNYLLDISFSFVLLGCLVFPLFVPLLYKTLGLGESLFCSFVKSKNKKIQPLFGAGQGSE